MSGESGGAARGGESAGAPKTGPTPGSPEPMSTAKASRASLGPLVLTVFVPTLLLSIGSGAVSAFLPLYLRSMGASVAMAATIIGIGTAGILLFDLPSGFITSRYGERITLTASSVVMAGAALLIGASGSLAVAGLGIFLTHAAASFWFLGRLTYMRNALPTALRGRGLATAGGVMRIGQLCGPIAGGYLAEASGYRVIFYATAGLAAASLLCFLAFDRTPRRGASAAVSAAAPSPPAPLAHLAAVLKAKRHVFLTAGTSMILLSLVRAGRGLIVPLWGQGIGLDTSSIGLVVGLASAADTLMFYPGGVLSDRMGRKWSAISCMIVISIGTALLPLTGSFGPLLLVCILIGLGNGLGSGINMTLGADFAKGTDTGVFLGLWRLVTDIGVAGAPLIVGAVAGIVALGPAALVVAGLGLVGAVFHGLFVEETLEGRHRRNP